MGRSKSRIATLNLVLLMSRESLSQVIIVVVVVALLCAGQPAAFAQQYLFGRVDSALGTNLVLSIATGDFNSDGIIDVAVVVGSNNTVSILLGKPNGTLQTPVSYATGSDPVSVTVGDFNADGKLDIAVTNATSNTVSILLGNGDGTFQSHVDYATASGPGSMTTGDFNHDGKLDLAVVDSSSNAVSVLLGNGDGTFQAHRDSAAGTAPIGIAAADFNADGKLDLAVSNNTANVVSVLLGNGDGTFQPGANYGTGAGPVALVAADLNGDGKADLAVCDELAGAVSILLGNGDGTFQVHLDYSLGGETPVAIVAADFNGDGLLDLAVAASFRPESGRVSVLLGNGKGVFQTHADYATTGNASALATADVNGDGKFDLAVTSYFAVAGLPQSSLLSVFLGHGDGSFFSSVITSVQGTGSVRGLATGDFNADGKLDVAVADGGATVLLGKGDGSFQLPANYTTGGGSVSVAAGDFNGDGKLDLVTVNGSVSSVSVLLGNGDGTFQNHVDYGVGVSPTSVAIGDFNADGKLDLAVTNEGDNTVSILLGNGDGSFKSRIDYATGHIPKSVAAGDFNGDGKVDLAVANFCGSDPSCNSAGSVSVLLGNGDGTFKSHVDYTTGPFADAVAAGDFNADGKLDLVVANQLNTSSGLAGNSVSILLGNGDGTFQPHVDYAAGDEPYSVATGDLNGDGKLDLEVASLFDGTIGVLLGNGDGTFQADVAYAAGDAAGVVIGDFNGDGLPDVGVANYCCLSPTVNSVTIILNTSAIALYPSVVNFGKQPVGTSSPAQLITLSNPGVAPLALSGVSASGDYAETNGCPASVLQEGTCTVSVTFTPTAEGARPGAVTFNDNAPGSPQSVGLTGIGVSNAIVVLSSTSLSFGNQLVGTTSAPQTVNLANTGTGPLDISSFSTSLASFLETNNCPKTLAAGASCTINVSFTPAAAGTLVGSLNIKDDGPANPHVVALSGTGTQPVVTISPPGLNFPNQLVGTTRTAQTVTLSNSGTATLTITSIAPSGDFTETNNCGSVAVGKSCTITVTFAPTAAGSRIGTLTITDNSPGSPQTVSLSGTGTDFTVAAAAGSSTTATVTRGQTATYTLSFAGTAGFAGTLSLGCSGAPSEAACTPSPASLILNGTTPANSTITVTTTAPSLGGPSSNSHRGLPNTSTPKGFAGFAWMLLLLTTLTALGAARRRPLGLRAGAPFAAIVLVALLWSACGGGGGGGGGGNPGTPAGTYLLTVTATFTSGTTTLKHTQNLTLTVQ